MKYKVLDLFSGCGGLTEGFLQTRKFEFLAHIEWEKPMVDTLRANLVERWKESEDQALKRVIHFDIQLMDELLHGNWSDKSKEIFGKTNDKEIIKYGLDGLLKGKAVDVIIGGPPCQAYSLAGRAQDPNSMKLDYRNYLFESFVKLVDYYKPKVFIFENVPGMLSAKPGDKLVVERIKEAFNNIGYVIRDIDKLKHSIYSAADFGVPQERRRVLLFGVRKECNNLEEFYKALDIEKSRGNRKTVKDAIQGLPRWLPLTEPIKVGKNNVSHKQETDKIIPLHIARYHNLRDIRAFKIWIMDNMNSASTKEKIAFYKAVSGRDTNHNKYRNLEWDKPSPTIVSHLYKDGLLFIHPDINQARAITIKEAALLQSFPNDYIFKGSNAYCYKMIGNAVPVLLSKGIANAIVKVLGSSI